MGLFYFALPLFFISATCQTTDSPSVFEVSYEWTYVNFTWPSSKAYQNAVSTGDYIPGNNAMVGIKYYEGKMYIALVRIKPGTPVTLAYIPIPAKSNSNPLLIPYPSWNMNVRKSCKTLQNVQSMEIDSKGIMWVLDGNRYNNFTNNCPPKLVLFDLNNNNSIVQTYVFDGSLCPTFGCSLNDLVVDDDYAYITEHSHQDPGIVVYSRTKNRAWKARDTSMFAEKNAANFSVDGISNNNALSNLDGIALTPALPSQNGEKMLIYCPLTGYTLYSISNAILKDEDKFKNSNWRYEVKTLGQKSGNTDGMTADSENNLYYGLLETDAVAKWNVLEPFEDATVMEANSDTLKWPDSFTFDNKGAMYLLANDFSIYTDPNYNLSAIGEVRFRILKTDTGTNSYLYVK